MSKGMPKEWLTQTIGSLGSTFNGLTGKSAKDFGSGEPFITYLQVFNGINSDIDKYGRVKIEQNEKQKQVQYGDILFTTSSETPEEVGIASVFLESEITPFLNSFCFGFRLHNQNILFPNFAYYYFAGNNFRKSIFPLAQGSTRYNLSKTSCLKLEINFPPFPEQKKIASILTSVDEVIENTQKQIDKLQDLKKGTMDELLTKGIDHTDFKDSELGRIPKSWEVKRLDEVSNISRGKFSHRPRNAPEFHDGNHPYLQTGDIPNDVTDITSFTQTLNDRGLGVSKLFPKGTLVLTIAATIGEVGILTFDSCFPDSLVGINCKTDKITPYFLLYSLRFAKQKLISEAPESAQKNVNLDILNPFLIKVPALNEQKGIETILLSIDRNLKEKTRKLLQTQSLKTYSV